MMTVAYYTIGTPYEHEAKLLHASLDRVGMVHLIAGLPDAGDWYANTAQKPEFIRQARATIAGPLLYVDADAFVHRNCATHFAELGRQDVDFAAHWFAGPAGGHNWRDVCHCIRGRRCNREHRLLSGTLFFGDTDGARLLLDEWCQYNIERRGVGHMDGGGQRNLWATWTRLRDRLKTQRLPGRYTYVFDKPWAYPRGEPRIIEHTVASRENRDSVRVNAARRARKQALAAAVRKQPA